MTVEEVLNNCVTFWKPMTQPRSETFGFVTFNPCPLRRFTRIYFIKWLIMSVYSTVYSVSNILHNVVIVRGKLFVSYWQYLWEITINSQFIGPLFLSGHCPVLKPTVPDQEKCLTVATTRMNNKSFPSFHGPNKCSIRALFGSRNHSVTSAAESSLATEWWVIGRDLHSEKREIDDKHNKRRLLLLILLKSW